VAFGKIVWVRKRHALDTQTGMASYSQQANHHQQQPQLCQPQTYGVQAGAFFATPGVGGAANNDHGGSYDSTGTQGRAPGRFMTHPQLGTVKGPQENEEEGFKEELPYPVYIRPYDDELPQVTWRKNPLENFGTLTIVKGEDKMIVKVPMKNDRILPRTNYPVEVITVFLFAVVAILIWRVL